MKRILFVALICSLLAGLPAFGSEEKLPIIDGKTVVAAVDDAPITLEEFNRVIAASHETRPGKKTAGRIDYSSVLKRLIDARLILLEARNMGLDELPEIDSLVEDYAEKTLVELILAEQVKNVQADEHEVERLYKEYTKEWRIRSIRFEKEEEAEEIEKEIKVGKNFDELAQEVADKGIAQADQEGQYFGQRDLRPAVARLAAEMQVGSVSPIVSVGKNGFIIFRLEDERFPENDDPEARERASREALDRMRTEAVREYYSELKMRHVKLNEELFAALDYESKDPGFKELLKDNRVVAEISGEQPIRVSELTKALKQKFYHGVEGAIESKRVNQRKTEVLEAMLRKRILLKEAFEQGIDKTEAYKNTVSEYKNSLIFGVFIKRVIVPDIGLDVKELKAYYEENLDGFTSPEMLRVKSLVFRERSDAENAMEKLTRGAAFSWLSSNAESQVDKSSEGLLEFEGKLLTVSSLPQDLQTAVSGSSPGDFRLYASPEGYYYILYIYHVIPPKPQPFEDVKKGIADKVFAAKVKKAVEDYADKLREYYPVEIYAKDLQ